MKWREEGEGDEERGGRRGGAAGWRTSTCPSSWVSSQLTASSTWAKQAPWCTSARHAGRDSLDG